MISQTAEYALRAVVCLAMAPAGPRTTPEISRLGKIPEGYLAKVMRALVRARLVRSRRGVGGGYELAETPARLTVLSVVQAVDPIRRIATCPLELSQHRGGLCPLHRRLDQAAASLEALLGGTSILELLDVPRARRPLCLARPGRRGG